MSNKTTLPALCVAALFFIPGQSCVTVTNNPGPGDGDGGSSPSDVSVRFVNQTPRAVDVQFYATGGSVGNFETDLFIPANQITANIGFAGTGRMQVGDTDEVTVSCASAAVIGTRGGQFLDADSGVLIGTGRQLVLVQGLQYGCGDTVTFTFTESGGTFSTGLTVE